jgi:hypothetical protein
MGEDGHARNGPVRVKSTFLDEKAAAIHALGEFARSCPLKFEPYFEKALTILDTTFDYFHDNVREQSTVCYEYIIEGLVKCAHGGELPPVQRGLPCVQ